MHHSFEEKFSQSITKEIAIKKIESLNKIAKEIDEKFEIKGDFDASNLYFPPLRYRKLLENQIKTKNSTDLIHLLLPYIENYDGLAARAQELKETNRFLGDQYDFLCEYVWDSIPDDQAILMDLSPLKSSPQK